MRGGAQAHLIEAQDEKCYVVKFRQNPQHHRILVNEMIAGCFLKYLRIPSPEIAVIEVTPEFLEQNPQVHIELGSSRRAILPGWHFGSCFGTCTAGDPDRLAIYDFLPDVLLQQVANLRDFLGVLVFDQWMGNADSRQAVFFRATIRDWKPGHGSRHTAFIALMIDHGFIINGPHWEFADSPLHGLYHRPLVYESVTGWNDFQPWLDQVKNFPEEVIDQALGQIPGEWLEQGEDQELQRLMERLLRRRSRLEDNIEGVARRGRIQVFPNWE
jgi:hypothetical protein